MIERDHPDLSIGQQCALLSIPRSSFYYSPQGEAWSDPRIDRAGPLPDVAYYELKDAADFADHVGGKGVLHNPRASRV